MVTVIEILLSGQGDSQGSAAAEALRVIRAAKLHRHRPVPQPQAFMHADVTRQVPAPSDVLAKIDRAHLPLCVWCLVDVAFRIVMMNAKHNGLVLRHLVFVTGPCATCTCIFESMQRHGDL